MKTIYLIIDSEVSTKDKIDFKNKVSSVLKIFMEYVYEHKILLYNSSKIDLDLISLKLLQGESLETIDFIKSPQTNIIIKDLNIIYGKDLEKIKKFQKEFSNSEEKKEIDTLKNSDLFKIVKTLHEINTDYSSIEELTSMNVLNSEDIIIFIGIDFSQDRKNLIQNSSQNKIFFIDISIELNKTVIINEIISKLNEN